jgi:hypothetical protein
MKAKQACLPVFIVSLMVAGCTERQRQDISHYKSDLVGLKRTVTLYSGNGQTIKTWKGRFKVETKDGVARFLHDGKAIVISGTYVIEED